MRVDLYPGFSRIPSSVREAGLLFSTILLLQLLEPGLLKAQELSYCNVKVRLVAPSLEVSESAPARLAMSSFVADADEQLASLPYSHYRPLDMKESRLAVGDEVRMELQSDQTPQYTLFVRANSITEEQVCLRVDWKEMNGRSIVSTKLKVPNGENVVLGSDRVSGGPSIILIKPMCE